MAEPAHVLVFDSGVGALSIIAEIREKLPGCAITYASDAAFFPYGDKPEAELIHRVDKVLRQLSDRFQPNIIVVACNTASTVTLPKIREHFNIPIVGVVPAIRPAAQLSSTKVIGLLATPGTVSRQYTRELINEFASDCLVISVGTSELVLQAERKLRGETIDTDLIDSVANQLWSHPQGSNIDTVVLACTHFPLLAQELAGTTAREIRWIDSGEAIARRVAYWIDEHKLAFTEAHFHTAFIVTHDQLDAVHDKTLDKLKPTLNHLLPGPVESITVD